MDRIEGNPGSVAVITDAGTKVRVSDTAQVMMTKHTCALCRSLPQILHRHASLPSYRAILVMHRCGVIFESICRAPSFLKFQDHLLNGI